MKVITTSNSWQEFEDNLSKLNSKEKGNAFEELTRLYFLTDPLYLNQLNKIWNHYQVGFGIYRVYLCLFCTRWRIFYMLLFSFPFTFSKQMQ
jgi:hypothetical protein